MSAAVTSGADPLAITLGALPHMCKAKMVALAYADEPTPHQVRTALDAAAEVILSMRDRMGHAMVDKERGIRDALTRAYDVAMLCAEHGVILAKQRDDIARLDKENNQLNDERQAWVSLLHDVTETLSPEAKALVRKRSNAILTRRKR